MQVLRWVLGFFGFYKILLLMLEGLVGTSSL